MEILPCNYYEIFSEIDGWDCKQTTEVTQCKYCQDVFCKSHINVHQCINDSLINLRRLIRQRNQSQRFVKKYQIQLEEYNLEINRISKLIGENPPNQNTERSGMN
jgi:hypothetical protein